MRGFPLFCAKVLFLRETLANALMKDAFVHMDFETNTIHVGRMTFTQEFLEEIWGKERMNG